MTDTLENRIRRHLAVGADPLPDLAERSIERALRPRGLVRLRTLLQHRGQVAIYGVAAAFVIVLAIALGAATIGHGLTGRVQTVSTEPDPSGRDYGRAPRDQKLIWMVSASHPGLAQAVSWEGRFVGTLRLPPRAASAAAEPPLIRQAPDGQRLALVPGAAPLTLLDASGAVTGRSETAATPIWTRDGAELCRLQERTGGDGYEVTGLDILTGTGAERFESLAGLPFLGKEFLAACDPAHDRALITSSLWLPTELRLVRPSNRSVLYRRTYPSPSLENIVASSDATLVAENPVNVVDGGGQTVVRRTSDGAVVGSLPAGYQALGFSSSGDRVLSLAQAAGVQTIAAVDWRSGSVVWTYATPALPEHYLVEPGGEGFAVELDGPTPDCPNRPVDTPICYHGYGAGNRLVIFDGSGRAKAVPGRWFGWGAGSEAGPI